MVIIYLIFALLLLVFLLALIEQQRPLSRIVFPLMTKTLKSIKAKAIATPLSPFQNVSPELWIAESENAYAIRDIRPRAPHHYLIIPKQRVNTLLDANAELVGEMLMLCKRVAQEQNIAEDGFRIVINTNPHGLQTVYHLHMHVLGGRQMRLPIG